MEEPVTPVSNMDWMVTIEDQHGCICGDPEWFSDCAAAVKWGEQPKTLHPGWAVVLYRVEQQRVIQERNT